MLYRSGGRPTSVELLFLVVVSQLAFSLSRQPPLVLLHLLGVIGAARGLVSLGGIEALEVGGWVTRSSAAGEARRVWSACWASGETGFYDGKQACVSLVANGSRGDPTGKHSSSVSNRTNTHQSPDRDRLWQGRENKAVGTHVCLREAFPFQAASYRS